MIELIAHTDPTWPAGDAPVYQLRDRRLGMLLGMGRNVALTASLRLAEEGYGAGTEYRITFVDERIPPVSGAI